MRKRRELFMNIAAFFIVIIFLFPLYWIVSNSFKLDGEIFRATPTLWPEVFTLQPYRLQLPNLALPLRNSLVIAFGSMFLSLFISIPAAYGLARFRMRGLKLIVMVFLVTQMLPASLVLTPLFLIFSNLDLLNTFLAPILSTATISIPFSILLLRPNFLHVPRELEEAARIDGCNIFSTFMRIAIPISKPAVVTSACFGFVFAWNDLAFSMTFNTRASMRPMTAAIYTFMNQFGTQWNNIMAYGVFLIIPTCIMFVTMQKYIVGGLVSGSVKG
jgi:multiple sugar transport system permease protein